ncbi:cobalamin biosynthesis protein CbiG [Caulobacter sp. S45]|uniref:cobalamin biosynthesis protein CbiG n=1 Tax=Caulobacter sp. S45 TaxID=1641861 RepID=UPI00131C1252|nr:cobalamin biosynthesis protein CbiG [Caulobacter sp. S45]
MPRLFNSYVMVDWSAATTAKTGKDSIWIGVTKRDIRFRPTFEAFNPPTRHAAEAQLRAILTDLRRRNDTALIGFDFSLGYPAGTAEMLKLKTHDYAAMWAFLAANVVDKPDNTNNRFAVAAKMNRLMTEQPWPFWGAPARDAQTWLSSTKTIPPADFALPVLRRAEQATQGAGRAGAKSVWQVFGNGAVGGQTLVGVPAVKRLADELGDKALLWPFQSGWRELTPADLDGREAVIAEIYPAMVEVKAEPGEVNDRAQVRALCEHFARLDEQGRLGPAFAAPKDADPELVERVEREEGWILGVG